MFFRKRKQKQYTFVHCPKCNNELISSNSFIKDDDGIIKYKCKICGNVSFWDFVHYPIPILRTCGDCHFFECDDFGNKNCSSPKACIPDTQCSFIQKGTYCDYCMGAKPLVIGDTNDQGIAIQYPGKLIAYGYDVHGSGSNGLVSKINYCPMCCRKLNN